VGDDSKLPKDHNIINIPIIKKQCLDMPSGEQLLTTGGAGGDTRFAEVGSGDIQQECGGGCDPWIAALSGVPRDHRLTEATSRYSL
jgi:hypothetical protein